MYLSLVNNVRDVWFKNDTDLHSLHTVSIGEMNNKSIGKWSEGVIDKDKRVGIQVLELSIETDSLNKWVFYKGEIFDIINFVCVILHQTNYLYIMNF